MDFTGISLTFIDGENGKYGVVVNIPQHLKVVSVLHKKGNHGGMVDPILLLNETVGINLKEVE